MVPSVRTVVKSAPITGVSSVRLSRVRARYWLIDLPASITDHTWRWYRFINTWWLIIGGIICNVMVLTVLLLYFGFGIRWGW